LSAHDIAEQTEALGMTLTSAGTRTTPRFHGSAVGQLRQGLDHFESVLAKPTFPSSEVAKVREDLIRSAKSIGDRPFEFTNLRFAQTLYRKSPYRFPAPG
jgi:predicted Zn-dependent peptidase